MIRTKTLLGDLGCILPIECASNDRADRNYLKPRLTLLMQLQGVWGEISNLYGSGESIFTDQVIHCLDHDDSFQKRSETSQR